MNKPLVLAYRLAKWFPLPRGVKGALQRFPIIYSRAVDIIDFSIYQGETFALVGESGSGKTTTGRLLLKLIDVTSGEIYFGGIPLKDLMGYPLKVFRRQAQMIFQDPYSSLDPRFTIGASLEEPLIIHRITKSEEERKELVAKILEDVRLIPPEEFTWRFPHQLSGGQRQRVAIARALILRPKFIVADEPVSMLDVSIRAEILELMRSLKEKYNLTYLYITHDLSTARYIADRIAVMYLGKIIELGSSDEVIEDPLHPYTQALVAAVPEPNPELRFKLKEIKIIGEIPSSVFIPPGCRFHPRCPYVMDICKKVEPQLVEVKPNHFVACHLYSGNKPYQETVREEIQKNIKPL
jgi:peptide/nickel transport system ATP-binding protein